MQLTKYKLTQYSHGAGCGCKISPEMLAQILSHSKGYAAQHFDALLVGNEEKDDAAVFDLGDGTAVISTTDFFMPIVDDAEDFGRIASVNALSDVYAMGGTPLVAIAILGWPVNDIPGEVAGAVLRGAQHACSEAGIPLGGGHSIDSPEPIFGLAVTGRVDISNLKRNNGAQPGDVLFLTKPVGVGVFTTAQKKGLLRSAHHDLARDSMVRLNKIGEIFGELEVVHAMTDVTGFGLGGHLLEMCQASGLHAELKWDQIPLLHNQALEYYHAQGSLPGGTERNHASYGNHLGAMSPFQKAIICDPQTSGGLLVAVAPEARIEFLAVCTQQGESPHAIGRMTPMGPHPAITLQ